MMARGKSSLVQVTLTKDLQKFVTERVRAGGYSSPSEVVREALRALRDRQDPAEIDSRELSELLLVAVRGPHQPLTEKHFDQLRRRARREILPR